MVVLRNIAAVVAGLFLGMLVVLAADLLALGAFPPPAEFMEHAKARDNDWLRKNVDQLPTGTGVVMVVGWGLAVLIAAIVAGLVAGGRKLLCALIAGDLILVGTMLNLVLLPHPSWMWPAGIMAICVAQGMALVGGFLALGWRLK